MKALNHVIYKLDQSMQRSLSYSSHQLMAVGAIAFIGFPLFYWIWTVWYPQPYETLTLRLIGSILGLGLMITPYWPQKLKPYLPGYWFLTILFTLPFFFTYWFLMNHANTISAMSLLCAVFLLVLLVDLYSLCVFLILGWALAYVSYDIMTLDTYFGQEHIQMMLVVLFIIIAGSTVNYKTAQLQQQRLAGMAAVAGMIAHELRTPLLGIKSGAVALSKYVPPLISAYHEAHRLGGEVEKIRASRIGQLEGVSARIISEIDYANTIIDMLLIKAGSDNTLANCVLEPCSMADCLNIAIERYPFKSAKERALVQWTGDFDFMGSKLLMQHVLFNLLKNALYVIATVQKGDIHIWAERGDDANILHVKDTASGMSRAQVSRLFNHFYTTTFMGTGLGLSFCKLVMHRFGGDIHCEAKQGQYTHFRLVFPV